jgi:hypothetical protein
MKVFEQLELGVSSNNYRVRINGEFVGFTETAEQAWELIGRARFGSGHIVTSPTGKDTGEFVPY